jgi:hypothetical protein
MPFDLPRGVGWLDLKEERKGCLLETPGEAHSGRGGEEFILDAILCGAYITTCLPII